MDISPQVSFATSFDFLICPDQMPTSFHLLPGHSSYRLPVEIGPRNTSGRRSLHSPHQSCSRSNCVFLFWPLHLPCGNLQYHPRRICGSGRPLPSTAPPGLPGPSVRCGHSHSKHSHIHIHIRLTTDHLISVLSCPYGGWFFAARRVASCPDHRLTCTYKRSSTQARGCAAAGTRTTGTRTPGRVGIVCSF